MAGKTKLHWENVYENKTFEQSSWYQREPETSLNMILSANAAKNAPVIDVGGGESYLAERLLCLGFNDITVLDISSRAIERGKKRIGKRARKINWMVSNILDFGASKRFDVWHDRATFHFLTTQEETNKYAKIASKLIKPNGHLIIGIFSSTGPKKCSGLDVIRYSKNSMKKVFANNFQLINSLETIHTTPFNTEQNFIFCHFRRV